MISVSKVHPNFWLLFYKWIMISRVVRVTVSFRIYKQSPASPADTLPWKTGLWLSFSRLNASPGPTMQPELPIMNWVWSNPPSHKVGCAQKHSIVKWKWHLWYWTRAGPKDISKLHEEVAQMPMTPIPATLPSISQPASTASWGVPYNQLTEHKLGLAVRTLHTLSAHSSSLQNHKHGNFINALQMHWF